MTPRGSVLVRLDGGTGVDTLDLGASATQAALGWTNGSYAFPAAVRRHQLIIDGDTDDVVASAAGAWINVGTVFSNGHTYKVCNSITGRSQVLVNDETARTGSPADGEAIGHSKKP
jgi:hypothetical protein